jgi:hypothetical protein
LTGDLQEQPLVPLQALANGSEDSVAFESVAGSAGAADHQAGRRSV